MNLDEVKTQIVHSETSVGQYGIFKLEIRVNTEDGYEPTEPERIALYSAADAIKSAFMKARIARDPECAKAAERERAGLLGLFTAPIFVEEIPNGYCKQWCCAHLPWFRVTTKKGIIELGWRKRVIQIEWHKDVAGNAKELFPAEEVTKGENYIHAWSLEDAQRYINLILA